MRNLLRLIQLTTGGASIMRALFVRICIADIRMLLVLAALSQAMIVLLIGLAFYAVYLGLVTYAACEPRMAFLIVLGGAAALALMVFSMTLQRLRRITRLHGARDRFADQIGGIAEAFIEGFREESR